MSEANYYYWGYHDFFKIAKIVSKDEPVIAYKSTFTPVVDDRLIVTYYVRLEGDLDLTIDKYHQTIDLVKGREITIGIYDPVPHSLKLTGGSDNRSLFRSNLIKVTATSLDVTKLFPDTLATTINKLNSLNHYSFVDTPPIIPPVPEVLNDK